MELSLINWSRAKLETNLLKLKNLDCMNLSNMIISYYFKESSNIYQKHIQINMLAPHRKNQARTNIAETCESGNHNRGSLEIRNLLRNRKDDRRVIKNFRKIKQFNSFTFKWDFLHIDSMISKAKKVPLLKINGVE